MLLSKVFYLLFLSFLISGCIQQGDVIEEKDHPAFELVNLYLKSGKIRRHWMNSLPSRAALPNRRNLILSAVAYFFPSTPEKTRLLLFITLGVTYFLNQTPGNLPRLNS